MKKITISQLFLYRYRFVIGYIVLGLLFAVLLVTMPMQAQSGLSEAEVESATNSYWLGKNGILNGDLVNLPYRLLQKASILFLGLTPYAIKLPSIVIGFLLGFLLTLLLNRWFKSNVSLLASALIILSTPFLFLAGSGTPLIMIVFWPTLLLWLGSKIQGEKKPKPLYCFAFILAMLASIFTPFMIYFAIFCVMFVLMQPHLRFVVRNLPKIPLALCVLVGLGGFTMLGFSIYHHPEVLSELLFANDFKVGDFWRNVGAGLSYMFAWQGNQQGVLSANLKGVFLAPLISLPSFALALIGLFSTTKGFFASRNSIASLLLVFTLVITGFDPNAVIFFILPFAILIAHGIKYLLEKWYGLFPTNPYARIAALLPLSVLFGLMIFPPLLQYYYGYRYSPNVTEEFSDDLAVIWQNLDDETLVVDDNIEFYRILEEKSSLNVASTDELTQGIETSDERLTAVPEVVTTLTEGKDIAYLGRPATILPENYQLKRIITSPKRDNSDILYLYTKIEEGE